jgi:hypothetical protein
MRANVAPEPFAEMCPVQYAFTAFFVRLSYLRVVSLGVETFEL